MNIAVLTGFLIFLVLIGFLANRKNKKDNIAEYFVVSRSLGFWLTAGTYGASFLSAGTFIGAMGTTYAYGWSYILQLVGAVGGVFFLAMVFVPKFWRYGYYSNGLSMPDLFGDRYDRKWSRSLFAIVILIVYTCGMASMYLGLNAVWGLISDLPLMTIAVISSIVVLIYSLLGGARGVTWTDTFCLVCMAFAAVIVAIVLLADLGSMGGLAGLADKFAASVTPEGQPWLEGEELTALSNSYYTPAMTVAWALIWFLGNSSQPHQVTRAYLAKDEKIARSGIGLAMFVIVLLNFINYFISAYGRVNYPNLEKADYVFPTLIMDVFPDFIAAFVLVAIVAAIFSTCSTMLIICGQCVGYDIYAKVINEKASETSILKYSRIAMVVCSLLAIVITYFAQTMPSLLFLWSSSFAMLGATIAPSLFCAFYWKGATPMGNICSMIVGIGVSVLLYAFPALQPFGLHPLLPALTLSTLTIIIVSKFTKPAPQETLDKFYHPLVRYGETVARKKGLL